MISQDGEGHKDEAAESPKTLVDSSLLKSTGNHGPTYPGLRGEGREELTAWLRADK